MCNARTAPYVSVHCIQDGPFKKPTAHPLVAIPAAQCKALQYQGSCTNNLKGCSWHDGSCGFNVYGHRGSDRGNTCAKACATNGLKCVAGMEGTNNCACSHMDTVRQEFSCEQDLSAQKHMRNKAHFWCRCGGPKTNPIVPVDVSKCTSLSYTGSCTNGIKGEYCAVAKRAHHWI
jgi:hypothetical protein